MKYIILSILVLTSCGKQQTNNNTLPQQTVYTYNKNFSGYYVLPDSGYAEIINDSGNLQDITQLRISAKNNDGTIGLIPLTGVNNLPITNGKIIYNVNLTYANGNNIKADVGNSVLTGSLLTTLTIFIDSNKLNIRVQVSNNTGLLYDHTMKEL